MKKLILSLCFLLIVSLFGRDLEDIKASGELRHLGVPYANFVTGLGDGLDVELMQGFAKHLGVKYKYVKTSWNTLFGDLTGRNVKNNGNDVVELDKVEVKGDVIANGLTMLDWRAKVVNYSTPTFPSNVWLIARADSATTPVIPTGLLSSDISNVKKTLKDKNVLNLPDTCLDASLYNLKSEGANISNFEKGRSLIEMVPQVISGKNDFTLLDVPDALIALEKWSGEIKVIGPVSEEQVMGVGFRKDSPKLLAEFNKYFDSIKKDGTYEKMVLKYYSGVFSYYPNFFNK